MNISNYNQFVVPEEIAGRYTQLLIDSGASLTLINLHVFNQLPKYYHERAQPLPPNLCLQLADRFQLYVKYVLWLPITISNSARIHEVYVVPKLWRACIIGNDLIRKHNLQIDGGRQYAYFKRRQGTMRKQHLEEDTVMNEVNYILSGFRNFANKTFVNRTFANTSLGVSPVGESSLYFHQHIPWNFADWRNSIVLSPIYPQNVRHSRIFYWRKSYWRKSGHPFCWRRNR